MTYKNLAAGLLGLAVVTLGACQSPYAVNPDDPGIAQSTPQFPVRQDPNPPAPIATPPVRAEAPAPAALAPVAAQPTEKIETASLPPPPAVVAAPVPPAVQAAPAPALAPVAVRAPAPVMESRPIAAGPVVDADGPSESVTVKAGDTLYSISRRMDMSVKQVADINGIKEPYTLKPGQKIKGKPSRGKAYVVQNGDTLSAIARRFSVSASQVAQSNGADIDAPIRPGQRLILPKGYRDQGAGQVQVAVAPPSAPRTPPTPVSTVSPETPAARSAPVAYTAPAAPTPPPATYARVPQTPAAPPPAARPPMTQTSALAPNAPPAPRPSAPVIVASAPPATAAEIRTAGMGKFAWPLNGRQIAGFGARGGSQQGNGLNLAASMGTSVKAAGPGEVIYAGSELEGYGNLVLIRHTGGFVTVYAHLSQIGVKMKDQVRQGQEIGQVGQSGGVTEPQLYFEMRHAANSLDMAKPFDPMLVLPARQ